jgi:hypothetical protein
VTLLLEPPAGREILASRSPTGSVAKATIFEE